MALPTGSGSERLRRASVYNNNNTWANDVISGTALHIYTIISIIFTDQQNASGLLSMRINNGSNDIYLLSDQAHGARETFVYSDKIVLEEDDDWDLYNTCTAGHWWGSYIDQNFE